jgi:hypothetical protein
MVDLAFGRGIALIAAAMLAGCTTTTAPPVALASIPDQASNQLRRQMSEAIESGDHVVLTHAALKLALMGGGMSDHGFDSFSAQLDRATLAAEATAFGPDYVEALRQSYHGNVRPMGIDRGPVAEVPAEYRIVEGIAYDRATDRLFVGTVVDGRLAYLHRGAWHEVPVGLPRSGLFGMAVDPRRRLLWIATGMVDESAVRSDPLSGLIAVDLDRLAVVERIKAAGEPGVPGDVTIGHDGTVYMSDSKGGAVQRLRPEEEEMRMLVPPGRFKSPQGMALSRDQRSLYVADYSTGLWIVRLSDGRVTPMPVPRPMMLDGIDGLVRLPRDNALIAVQNGTSPRRVIKLYLSPDGSRITRFETREIVPAAAGDPSLVTIRDGQLWFVGDGQWERYGPGGILKDGKPPRPTPILTDPEDDDISISAH